MIKLKKDDQNYHIVFESESSGTLNGKRFDLNVVREGNSFHLLNGSKSYNAEVVEYNVDEKEITVKVNNQPYTFRVIDRYEQLLKEMGMDGMASSAIKEIKAPMPGLVLDVIVAKGSEVKKGDPVFVLEAMKMENVLKSPADGTVKSIHVKKSVAVEKNEILLNFE